MVNSPAEAAQLETIGNVVPAGYRYYEKQVTPADDLSLPTAYLKWYNIYPDDTPITLEQMAECRAFIGDEAASGRLKLENNLGFVLLHRAGPFLLLMVITWRNTNELWESVYYKDANKPDTYVMNEFTTAHRGTYCVWELVPVWHERHAWVRFLSSPRDTAAKLAYINDKYTGRC